MYKRPTDHSLFALTAYLRYSHRHLRFFPLTPPPPLPFPAACRRTISAWYRDTAKVPQPERAFEWESSLEMREQVVLNLLGRLVMWIPGVA